MIRTVFRINEEGFYIEPVEIGINQPVPSDCVEEHPPEGIHKLKWNGAAWIEGLTQSEIDTILNTPKVPNELELLKKQQADLTFELMMKGVL